MIHKHIEFTTRWTGHVQYASTPIQGTSGKESVTNDLVVSINLIKWCTHVKVMYVCIWISHIKQCCIVSLFLICIINKAVPQQFSILGPTLRALLCIGEIQGWISLKTTVCGGGRVLCIVNGKACGWYLHHTHTRTCRRTHACRHAHMHTYTGTHKCTLTFTYKGYISVTTYII